MIASSSPVAPGAGGPIDVAPSNVPNTAIARLGRRCVAGSLGYMIASQFESLRGRGDARKPRPIGMELTQSDRGRGFGVGSRRLAWWRSGIVSLMSLMLAGPAFAQEATSGPAGAGPAASGAATTPVIGQAALPHDLSPWGMFLSADSVVKAVMIGLALASVVTWTVWLAKTIEIFAARRNARAALATLGATQSLAEARLAGRAGAAQQFLDAARLELQMSADTVDKDGVKERVASRLERIEAACGRGISRGTGVLATIGATAPFVGLFGTVWGIMNSFIGISQSHTTNLAVVAPGIAEALLATACGLVAAIPAVVIYNVFARWTAGYRAQLGDASAEVMRLLSRDLDRRGPVRKSMSTAAE